MHTETMGPEKFSAVSPCVSESSTRFVPLADAPLAKNAAQAALRRTTLSPSLQPWVRGEAPAFEMKFLLDEARARDVEGWLSTPLSPDPLSDRQLGNAYRVTTVYRDTPESEVFHAIGSLGNA